MKYCRKCVLPETRPNLVIGEDGVCNACRNHGQKRDIDWPSREQAFHKVVENAKARSQGYDCLIPVSGGKDSTWQVIKCLTYGLKPLCVTWAPPARTEIGRANLKNMISLGVDHIDYSISPAVEKIFTLRAFERFGSVAVPMHMAIFNIPLTIAARFDIPLVVWGENSAFEYGSADDAKQGFQLDREWVRRFGVTHGTTAEDWISEDLSRKDLTPYFGPSDDELAAKDIRAVFLGYYFEWDPEETYAVAKAHGFRERLDGAKTGYYDFADIDDDFISIHHWMKWYKFGFTRTWDNLSLEIRNGRISRDEAVRIIAERGDETPHEDIAKLCAFLDITTERFYEIAETFRDRDVWSKRDEARVIDGFLIEDWNWT